MSRILKDAQTIHVFFVFFVYSAKLLHLLKFINVEIDTESNFKHTFVIIKVSLKEAKLTLLKGRNVQSRATLSPEAKKCTHCLKPCAKALLWSQEA